MKNYFSYLAASVLVSTIVITSCMKDQLSGDELQSDLATLAPLYRNGKVAERTEEYIVVFKKELENVDVTVNEMSRKHLFKTKHLYKHALKGFAGKLSPKMLDDLRTDPRVAYIEEDGQVSGTGTQTPAPSWGMDRIDQRSLPLDSTYTYHYTGASVDAYIFDSGIRHTHKEFQGRIFSGLDAIDSDWVPEDENGHGTHVAGIVGGTTVGIAKNVRLIPVRVLGRDNTGWNSGVIAGFDWATNHHTDRPAVGNVSLNSFAPSQAMEEAVRRMIADGITISVSAGNNARDAQPYSPANVIEAITVGASDPEDNYAGFSNYGPLVDVFAPGYQVNSAWLISDTAFRPLSGTSMAAPHVVGTAALYMEAHPQATPAEVQQAIKLNASPNLIKSLPSGTPNLLLNAVWGDPPPSAAPFAPALILPAPYTTVSRAPVLSWDHAAGATSYHVQIATDLDFYNMIYSRSGITTTSIAGILLPDSAVYFWRVKASNATGTSEWSATRAFFTTSSFVGTIPYPYVPFNQATNVIVPTTFTWNATHGARAYRMQVSTNREFTQLVYAISNYSSTTITVKGLQPGRGYYWRVSAIYLTSVSPWSAPASFTTFAP